MRFTVGELSSRLSSCRESLDHIRQLPRFLAISLLRVFSHNRRASLRRESSVRFCTQALPDHRRAGCRRVRHHASSDSFDRHWCRADDWSKHKHCFLHKLAARFSRGVRVGLIVSLAQRVTTPNYSAWIVASVPMRHRVYNAIRDCWDRIAVDTTDLSGRLACSAGLRPGWLSVRLFGDLGKC
jgi:hypothetical protein